VTPGPRRVRALLAGAAVATVVLLGGCGRQPPQTTSAAHHATSTQTQVQIQVDQQDLEALQHALDEAGQAADDAEHDLDQQP
jgi:outer membrane murein-binding lipoprotein Lpp